MCHAFLFENYKTKTKKWPTLVYISSANTLVIAYIANLWDAITLSTNSVTNHCGSVHVGNVFGGSFHGGSVYGSILYINNSNVDRYL